MIRAGRLTLAAIDIGVFTAWDRAEGRVPGGPHTIYNQPTPPFRDGKPDEVDYRARIGGVWTDAQCDRCWRHTIQWLRTEYPEYFRPDSADLLWDRALIDANGRLLCVDGKPVRRRWYKGDQPMPDDFNPTPRESIGYTSKLEHPPAMERDTYNNPDCAHHVASISEISSDACALLVELVGAAGGREGEGDDDCRDKFVSADSLFRNCGIKPYTVSRDTRVRRKNAPPGEVDSSGRAVRILYSKRDAIRYCSPKRWQTPRATSAQIEK